MKNETKKYISLILYTGLMGFTTENNVLKLWYIYIYFY